MTAVFADSGFFVFALSFCFYYFVIFAINRGQIGVFGSENLINRAEKAFVWENNYGCDRVFK